jgi:formate-dependent nitrite reductase membrane component NrfD
VEGATLAAYLTTAGDAAQPLMKGRYSWHLWLGAVGAGMVLPTLMGIGGSSKKRRKSRTSTIIKSALTLAGGLALKLAITYAGKKSAMDVEAARNATRPGESAPGWGPG